MGDNYKAETALRGLTYISVEENQKMLKETAVCVNMCHSQRLTSQRRDREG